MKILAICGSPRTIRSTTRRLVSRVLEGAKAAGADTEIVDLCDLRIIPCSACEACSLSGTCVNDDDMGALLERMTEADGILLASPVYIDNVSGQAKVFFDRLADAIHYQILAGKYGCSVATTHTSGDGTVLSYLDHVLNYLGIVSIGGISVATGGDADAVDSRGSEAEALGRKLAGAIADGYSDPAQETEIAGNREFFRQIVAENREIRTGEYDRWVRMGWIR